MRLVTAIFDRPPFLVLAAAAGVALLGCSGNSPAANPNPNGRFDATAADDASSAETSDGDSEEANRAVDAGLGSSTSSDGELPEAAAEDASTGSSTEAGVDAATLEAGPPSIDAGGEVDGALEASTDAAAGGGPDAGHPTFTSIYSDIITPNCLRCHAEPPPIESNLEMRTQQEAYGNLVNVSAMGDACGIRPPDGGPPMRVIPGDSADSLLYQKITNTQKCGSGMPLDSDSLPADQILVIQTWIDQGATNN
jgi:hypothetical protein